MCVSIWSSHDQCFDVPFTKQAWIETITTESCKGPFGEALRDGVLLCGLINVFSPGTIKRVNTSRMPFKQMENISNFLKACILASFSENHFVSMMISSNDVDQPSTLLNIYLKHGVVIMGSTGMPYFGSGGAFTLRNSRSIREQGPRARGAVYFRAGIYRASYMPHVPWASSRSEA